jgi:dCMP deaminase
MRFHSQNQEARERDARAEDEAWERLQKWDRRFLRLAKEVASWSKDPSTQTGAVIVRPDNTVASLGYNGFPRLLADLPEDYDSANRDVKLSKIVHCEMNAVLSAREPVRGYTLYTWPFMSCDRCAVHMIQAGIKRIVAPIIPEDKAARWADIMEKSMSYFKEAGVEMLFYPNLD